MWAGREHPVSRVLCHAAISLESGSRLISSDRTRGSAGHLIPSYSVLLRAGFTEPAGHPAAGELLPHLFTLARHSPVERDTFVNSHGCFPAEMVSHSASECRAVCFCGTFLGFAPTGVSPAPCPVEPGLSSVSVQNSGRKGYSLPKGDYNTFAGRSRKSIKSAQGVSSKTRLPA